MAQIEYIIDDTYVEEVLMGNANFSFEKGALMLHITISSAFLDVLIST